MRTLIPRRRSTNIVWPGGKKFAFTIVDDTDRSRLPKIKPVYDFLAKHGFRTTKTVWPLSPLGKPITGGQSLEEREYLRWINDLRLSKFEIALHGVSDETSSRERIIEGINSFREHMGQDPGIHVNHVGQKENIYWGPARVDFPVSQLYRGHFWLRRLDPHFVGHVEGSPYFWGDQCRQRIRFVRNFIWTDINTLRQDPLMPYHDPKRPYVRYWFSSSYGSGVRNFCRLISEVNQDRLMRDEGACIVYTHLGSSFYPLDREFKRLMRRLSSLPGWFVPASTLLDYLGEKRHWPDTSRMPLTYYGMQWRWFRQQLIRATGL